MLDRPSWQKPRPNPINDGEKANRLELYSPFTFSVLSLHSFLFNQMPFVISKVKGLFIIQNKINRSSWESGLVNDFLA